MSYLVKDMDGVEIEFEYKDQCEHFIIGRLLPPSATQKEIDNLIKETK